MLFEDRQRFGCQSTYRGVTGAVVALPPWRGVARPSGQRSRVPWPMPMKLVTGAFMPTCGVADRIARRPYTEEPFGVDLKETIYAVDSTEIDLCLSVFPWAHFRSTKAAVKMRTLLDLRGAIASVIHISDGKLQDVNVLDVLIAEPAHSTSGTATTLILVDCTCCIKQARSLLRVPSRISIQGAY
jgi:hypothetical protein